MGHLDGGWRWRWAWPPHAILAVDPLHVSQIASRSTRRAWLHAVTGRRLVVVNLALRGTPRRRKARNFSLSVFKSNLMTRSSVIISTPYLRDYDGSLGEILQSADRAGGQDALHSAHVSRKIVLMA